MPRLQLRHEFRGAQRHDMAIDFDIVAHLPECGVKKAVFRSERILTLKVVF